MINVNQITAQMARMSDPALQQFAAMHKADPYTLSLALSESNRRKQLRQGAQMEQQPQPKVVDQEVAQMGAPAMPPQGMPPQQLPEDVGIGQLPAPNMQRMAAGGIVAFEEGGEVPGYAGGTQVKDFVQKYAEQYNVDPAVLSQIIGVESGAKGAEAKNPKSSAHGLGQIIEGMWGKSGGGNRSDPETQVRNAANLLSKNNKTFLGATGRLPTASEAYTTWVLGDSTGRAVLSADPNASVEAVIRKADPKLADQIISANKSVFGGKKVGDVIAWSEQKMLPVLTGGAAVAATPTAATSGPSLVSRIPGQTGTVPEPVKTKPLTGNEMVTGAGETALQYGTGLLSLPFAAAAGAIKPGVPFEQAFSEAHKAMTYSPRTAGGQEVSEATSKALSGLPAIIPGATTAGMARGPLKNLPASTTAARDALSKSEQARAPRLPYEKPQTPVSAIPEGLTPEAVAIREAAVRQRQAREQTAKQQRQQTAMAGQAQDIAAADDALAAASARAARNRAGIDTLKKETDYTQGASNRAQNIATVTAAGAAGAGAPGVGAAGGLPDMAKAMNIDEESRVIQQAPPDIAPKDIEKIGKEATPKDERKGMSGEDFLMIGLGILSGQSPNALTNIGEGGLKGLQLVMAGRKEAAESRYRDALAKNYGVSPEIQLVNAMQDPAFAANYNKLQEAKNDPRQLQALALEMIKNPIQMKVLKEIDLPMHDLLRKNLFGGFVPPLVPTAGNTAPIRAPVAIQ
jgi:hypothetical protein